MLGQICIGLFIELRGRFLSTLVRVRVRVGVGVNASSDYHDLTRCRCRLHRTMHHHTITITITTTPSPPHHAPPHHHHHHHHYTILIYKGGRGRYTERPAWRGPDAFVTVRISHTSGRSRSIYLQIDRQVPRLPLWEVFQDLKSTGPFQEPCARS